MSGPSLDAPVRTTAAAPPPNASSPHGRTPHRLRADCTTHGDGSLTFDVRLSDETGKKAAAPEADEHAAVLLRLRHHHGPDASLSLPLTPAATDGGLRATLPATTWLREGRWDAYLAQGDEEPQRLLPGVHDLRSLLGGAHVDARAWLGVRIPYTTKHGNLTIRTWVRRPHAEAGTLRIDDATIALHGTLYGAQLSATACLEARPRDSAAPPVRIPVRPAQEEHSGRETAPQHTPGPHHPQHGFAAELPFTALLPGHRIWDLWLRPSADEEPVRVARILDDIPDKKHVFSYPSRHVASPDGTAHAVRPYYTVNNNLSVRVSYEAAKQEG
ncbi:hypothetical protein ITI46_07675 [Streptomyces oryzae]|uniref:Transferase n=1 Tax=Streptomyces oryzae TaxID=1434886 RepID=A0ABS3X917_9ACTN|nr:hypothetical protein [Streptomyces oryzae]MBO8191571.1 hypothetical protein [Streptomyces oryzae]